MEQSKKIGFQNTDKPVVATRGVKLKNKASEKAELEKIEKQQYKEKFERAADRTMQNIEDNNTKALNVISKFLKMSEDKTLHKNKGAIALDVEREIRQELIQLVMDFDNDATEDEYGKGSIIAISILSKIVLNLRDRLNDLEYELVNKKSIIK